MTRALRRWWYKGKRDRRKRDEGPPIRTHRVLSSVSIVDTKQLIKIHLPEQIYTTQEERRR